MIKVLAIMMVATFFGSWAVCGILAYGIEKAQNSYAFPRTSERSYFNMYTGGNGHGEWDGRKISLEATYKARVSPVTFIFGPISLPLQLTIGRFVAPEGTPTPIPVRTAFTREGVRRVLVERYSGDVEFED